MFKDKRLKAIYLFLLFVFISTATVFPTFGAEWKTLKGKHATIEFEDSYQKLAQNLLYLADQEIPRLAQLHGLDSMAVAHLPKARIILTDKLDISNGYALGNSVVIYALSSMYMLYWSEQAPWYFTVLTHELAHWVTFHTMKRKLNWFGQIAYLTIPRWFFEGLAQYCAETWNLYRGDRFLRQALLYGDLNYNALKNLHNGRLLYAAANAFVRFLVEQYGDSTLIKFLQYKEDGWYFDFDEAFKQVYKKSPKILFKEFIRHAVLFYGNELSRLPERKFTKLEKQKFMDQPNQMWWISNKDSIYLVAGRDREYQNFLSLKIVQIKNGQIKTKKLLTNNLTTRVIISPDRKWLAYGTPKYNIKADQLAFQFQWQIVNLKTLKSQKIKGYYRARYGAFDFANNFYLVEILPTGSRIYSFSNKNRTKNIFLKFPGQSVGPITFSADQSLFLIEEKNGIAYLLKYKKGKIDTLLSGATFTNLVMLNKQHLLLSSVHNAHLQWLLYDVEAGKQKATFVDQFEYLISDVDSVANQVWASRLGADGLRHFFKIPFDSIQQSNISTKKTSTKYGQWQQVVPVLSDSLFKFRRFYVKEKQTEPEKKILPYFPMEHLFTYALPFYDDKAGVGIMGSSVWVEALQRQMILGAFYVTPNNLQNSLWSFTYSLKAFNLTMNVGIYHGPVIFAFQNGKWVHMVEDQYALSLQKWLFPFTGGRWLLTIWPYFNYVKNGFVKKQLNFPESFKFKGGGISVVLQYHLPSKWGISFPVRFLKFKTQLFQTFQSKYSFRIFELDASFAQHLFSEKFLFWQKNSYLKQIGNLPPLKTLGLDRFYQLEIPRDYTYTRTIRGYGNDLLTNGLFWNSSEIRFLIKEKTSYKLIFIPINLVTMDVFFDYARLNLAKLSEVSSYGIQLSMAESGLRLSVGFAQTFANWKRFQKTYYFRLSLFLETYTSNFNYKK